MSANMNSLNGRGMYVWYEITPEMAAEWLTMNQINCKVRPRVVEQYASDMSAGKWRDADAPITRRADGVLGDGQHRLLAIIMSGVTIGAWVHIVSDDVAPMDLRVDVGKTRTIVDVTGLSSRQAATARALIRVAVPKIKPSFDMVADVVGRISPQYDALTDTTRAGIPCPMKAATCFSMFQYHADAETIAAQYDAMIGQNYDYPFWPGVASALRQCLAETSIGQTSGGHKFLRMARAFAPSGRGLSKIQMNAPERYRAEIAPKVAAYIGMADAQAKAAA